MQSEQYFSLAGKRAVLATMHRKEQVIQPLLEAATGLCVYIPRGFDTDRFGTFSREIERTGSQLDAARAKIDAGFDRDRNALVAIASEGTFGPHPFVPLIPIGREIVVLKDRETGLEIIGKHADMKTNFQHKEVTDVRDAIEFAERVGFPEHGVIAVGSVGHEPAPDRFLEKTISTSADLSAAVAVALSICGAAHIESDMRAHRNPTRMRSIKRATIDLLRRYRNHCPECARPGFAVTERLYGLPCSWCGSPTTALRAEISICDGCGYRVENPAVELEAEPGLCSNCNP